MIESPIDSQTFQRCQIQIICELSDDQNRNAGSTLPLADHYSATIRGAFNLEWNLPQDYGNIRAYEKCMTIPPNIPYYRQPNPNTEFSRQSSNGLIHQPDYSSLLPLLIAAYRNNINTGQYNIISERNSFRKLAMNNEDYVIGVQRFGPTLFLRRYDRRIVDMNDYGHQFEQMCTPDYHLRANYYQLVEGRFGNLRTLITTETDAISKQNGEAIELKCRLNPNIPENYLSQYWLQAFLGGVKTVVVGHRSNARPVQLIGDVCNYNVENIINDEEKNTILNRLYRILQFLEVQVQENEVYLFSRRMDQQIGQRWLYLYKVARQDKHNLAFISQRMLDNLSGNNTTRRQTSINRQNRKMNNVTTDNYNTDNDDDDDNMDLSEEDSNSVCGTRSSKMNRLNEKKKRNVSLRHAENQ